MPSRKKDTDKVDEVEETKDAAEESKADVAVAVTGRPNDNPIGEPERHFTNTTFAERAKSRNKRVSDADSK